MIEMGKNLGITTWEDRQRFGLSLTLGGGEVKMVDLTVAYGTLANLGQKVNLSPILQVSNYRGKVFSGYQCPQERESFPEGPVVEAVKKELCQPQSVLDPKIAYLLSHILSDNQARTPAFGAYSLLDIPGQTVAVKTGTTNNLRDNWTIGYTSDFLVAAWVGNNDNSPMSYIASGLTGASSIWNRITTALLANKENQAFPRPEGIIETQICPLTGTLSCQGCSVKSELFIAGTEPKVHCRFKAPEEKKEGEREKILGAQVDDKPKRVEKPKPTVVDYRPPKEGEVIWERIRR